MKKIAFKKIMGYMVIASMTWLIALDQNSVYPIISFFIFIFYIFNTIKMFPIHSDVIDGTFFILDSNESGIIQSITKQRKTDFLQIVEVHFDKIINYIHIPPAQNYLDDQFDFHNRGRINHKRLTPYTEEIYVDFKDEEGALFLYSDDFINNISKALAYMHFAISNSFTIYIDDKKEHFNFEEAAPWLNLLKNIQK